MAPPVVSPERGAVATDVLPFWGADHTAPHKEHLTEACKKHLDISRLLPKVYEVDPLLCPKCQGYISVVAIIEDPVELGKIIGWVMKQEKSPPVTVCARSPPEMALGSVYYPKTKFSGTG